MQTTRTKLMFRHLMRDAIQRNTWAGFITHFALSPELKTELPATHLSLLIVDDYSDESLELCISLRQQLSELYNSLPD